MPLSTIIYLSAIICAFVIFAVTLGSGEARTRNLARAQRPDARRRA